MEESNSVTSGTKAVGGILFLFAVVAGVYAMVQPMSQRIDFLERQLQSMNARMEADDVREGKDSIELARVSERFREVGTQFASQSSRIKVFEDWWTWWQRTVPGLDAKQNGRLDSIERALWGIDTKRGEEMNREYMPQSEARPAYGN